MDKIQRATEIHRSMTPHQMAMYIVDIDEMCTRAAIRINELLESRNATGVAIDNAIRGVLPDQHPMLSRLQMLANMAKRITELQDALELAEEAVRAKHFPDAAKMVPDGWKLVPVEPTIIMVSDGASAQKKKLDNYALSGSWPPIGHGIDAAYQAMLASAPKLGGK